MIRLSEAHLERQIADYLTLDGFVCRHLELNFSERKQRSVGEMGMPDLLCIRYQPLEWAQGLPYWAQVLWIECKRPRGRYSNEQLEWARRECRWGATVLHMGVDFEASLESFVHWYENSGLQRRIVKLQNRRTA